MCSQNHHQSHKDFQAMDSMVHDSGKCVEDIMKKFGKTSREVHNNFFHEMGGIQTWIKNFESEMNAFEEKLEQIDKMIEVFNESMIKRNNIILSNIPGGEEETDEELFHKVIHILSEVLETEFEPEDIRYTSRIRLVEGKDWHMMPVRVSFEWFATKCYVAKHFSDFQSSPYSASDDYTRDVLVSRRLRSALKKARKINGDSCPSNDCC
uniref:Serine--tRNA ligase 2 n=1 Tax=Lygus hesperus TaxID=30085 RepID=A0A0A9W7P3_LYGHE